MTTVAASGYFDPLHIGHIQYLKDAKLLGDKLVVILNRDDQRKRGTRMPQEHRKVILESLRFVDQVVLATDANASVAETLQRVRPDVFAKGSGAPSSEERHVCEEAGIRLVYGVGEGATHLRDLQFQW